MKVGLMLPLGRPFAADEAEWIERALTLGYSSLWLQEWPVGVGPPGSRDHGSGHDLLFYASHLSREYGARGAQVGLAVLRADYRHPYITARAVVSAQTFGGGSPFLLGLGMETKTSEAAEQLAQTWQVVRTCLYGEQPDFFLLPDRFAPPRMYLASGKPELWSATNYLADGWLTTRFDPRQIAAIAEPIRERVPHLDIIVQVYWRIDLAERDTLCRGRGDVLQIGEQRVRELVRRWREAGVSGIISYAPETPREDQLKLVADIMQEEG
jgi:hypothetical protein